MPVIAFLFFLSSLYVNAATLVEGMKLVSTGKAEGYEILEVVFLEEQDSAEKGRIAYVLAFAPNGVVKASTVYYARYALKYRPNLERSETQKLNLKVADSFLELGELEEAKKIYLDLQKSAPELNDYISYQLGYYYLNVKDYPKASELWLKLSTKHSLKSLGRYWERLGFPGNIKILSVTPSFLEGFSVFVDEREKGLNLKDLDVFVSKGASPQMLTLLIEKNPLFMKGSCDFVNWYNESLKLPNELVFPFLQRCHDKEPRKEKVAVIARAQAQSLSEKAFLISIEDKLGNRSKACALASDEAFINSVISLCEEKSDRLVKGIRHALKNKQSHDYLKQGHVLRSALDLTKNERDELMAIVSPQAMAQAFYADELGFLSLNSDHHFSDEILLSYALEHRGVAEKISPLIEKASASATKDLLRYLAGGQSFTGDACEATTNLGKKIALEAKLSSGSITVSDRSCLNEVIQGEKSLYLLALEEVIARASMVKTNNSADLGNELFSTAEVVSVPAISSISSVSPDWARDIELYLNVQNRKARGVSSGDGLLHEMKKLKTLRNEISRHRWSGRKVAQKATARFNEILDESIKINEVTVARLNLKGQFNSFIDSMRFP